ncbi:MAG: hypothetical protein FJZ00_08740 [Candidatus Sericytochromatia bacterium]|uniref:Uncharacterized protein n=1 Tax=Candidatus Tanganyikabacteria bacterium TaxID=2961651 RepID=A0A937X3K5_9BACT|nr:hypothetical protein [Candidatus Tanganyikabacteria bacterium]
MPKLANTLFAIACVLAWAIAGCAVLPVHILQTGSGRAAFDRGDYDLAVSEARTALLSQPGFEPAETLLVEAFRNAVLSHTTRIASARAVLDWDTVVFEHRRLADIDKAARPLLLNSRFYPTVAEFFVDRTDDLNQALGLAAETHYQAGLVLGAEAAKARKREAAREFKRVHVFLMPFKDAQERYDTSREAGTEVVAFEPFEEVDGSNAGRRIHEALRAEFGPHGANYEFVRFAARERADQAVLGRITRVSTLVSPVADTLIRTKTKSVGDGENRRQRKTEYRERSRTTTVEMGIDLRIIEVATGRELRRETLESEAATTQKWQEERERRDDLDDDELKLASAIGTLIGALLGADKVVGPALPDTAPLKAEAAEALAEKVSPWLRTYFSGL